MEIKEFVTFLWYLFLAIILVVLIGSVVISTLQSFLLSIHKAIVEEKEEDQRSENRK